VSRLLEWLQQLELVAKVIPVTDTPPGNPKKSLYRLADPYLAFWYRFVAPLHATGAVEVLTPTQLWERHVSPRLSCSITDQLLKRRATLPTISDTCGQLPTISRPYLAISRV
jgi:hypothetical protein